MKATVIHFYADIPEGTTGEIIKQWKEPNGNEWVKLFFGKNKSGQRLQRSFPADCVKIEKK